MSKMGDPANDAIAEARRRASMYARLNDEVTQPSPEKLKRWNSAVERLRVYAPQFREAEKKHGLPPGLLMAIAVSESEGRDDIILGTTASSAGAVGMMQFMPKTAAAYGLTVGDGVDDRKDPSKSIEAAAQMMRRNIDVSDGDLNYGLGRYNYGDGNMYQWATGAEDLPIETREYMGGIDYLLNTVGVQHSYTPDSPGPPSAPSLTE